nr:lysine--tRNA ligase [candidate division Zixibacteria bacterium]NIW46681.1 lysine--tRNA ligase [Gammaproteobacteria bacterium]NIS47308.1 lysine--tRNA ligase [candidate division Zixibacteria bacterium]NIT52193.1 lysine--tRNA ligase [candidate division Zixibacteria bacterium]NIU15420.1 lysine--tRNA ligase [candidate division Zixibacteria bacterium]
MDEHYSNLEKVRLEKIEELRSEGIEPFPNRAQRTHTNQEAIDEYLAKTETDPDASVAATLVGRLRSMRPMGKITFAHIEDESSRIQLFFRANDLGEDKIKFFNQMFDLGDFVQASGEIFRTRTGEITLRVAEFEMLAKAVTPLPAAKDEVVDGKVVRHATLADPETRYRQRYADLAVNEEVRDVFIKRAAIVRALRDFLDERSFLEVETPILQPIYGGAAAQPFVTHHNQLKQDLYLRISFELYLKRLLVGGFERVYEIGRDFRNEGVSFKHNPEFTQLEFYWAYADYFQVMELTEQMVSYVAERVLGKQVFEYQGHQVDVKPPWKRIELREVIIEKIGIDIQEHSSSESLYQAIKNAGLDASPNATRG